MVDYSFLQFIRPECVKKEELSGYVEFDSRITRFDVDNWLYWKIINVEDYKEYIKTLIERQEKELRQMKFMLKKAEKDGDEFSPPFLYCGMLNGCCCSSEYYSPAPVSKEVYNNGAKTLYSLCNVNIDTKELEREVEEKIGGKVNE